MPRPTVLVICPLYLPTEEGLAHYTTEFCRHLAKHWRVVVLTSDASREVARGPGGVEVLGTIRRWNWLGPARALRSALRSAPDRVLIEFVPFMYARRGGINLSLVLLAAALALRAKLRRTGDVQVMFHELWYPFGWQPKAFAMHAAHRLMVFGVAAVARDVFCATTRFAEQVKETLGPLAKPVHVLAVGSNLERDDAPPRAERRSEGKLKIALFGSVHPSKNVPLVLRTLHEAWLRAPRSFELTIIGLRTPELEREAPELSEWLRTEVIVEGPLDAVRAAERLADQDFLVAYFQDGASGRRGSLLAALCEGVPVVTTSRASSDRTFQNRAFVELLSCDEAEFRQGLLDFLGSNERPFAGVRRADVRRFYDEHFSWSAVIERYLELSSGAGGATRSPT